MTEIGWCRLHISILPEGIKIFLEGFGNGD